MFPRNIGYLALTLTLQSVVSLEDLRPKKKCSAGLKSAFDSTTNQLLFGVKNQEEAASLPEDEEEEDGGETQSDENVNKFLFLPGLTTI